MPRVDCGAEVRVADHDNPEDTLAQVCTPARPEGRPPAESDSEPAIARLHTDTEPGRTEPACRDPAGAGGTVGRPTPDLPRPGASDAQTSSDRSHPPPVEPAQSAGGAPAAAADEGAKPDPVRVEIDANGVLVRGTSKEDRVARDALRAGGFQWSRRLGAWYLPRNWNPQTKADKIERFKQAMARAGRPIEVTQLLSAPAAFPAHPYGAGEESSGLVDSVRRGREGRQPTWPTR